MTSRATEIQTLIADIDSLLAQKNRRLPIVLSSPGQPRQVLERIRDFLVSVAQGSPSDDAENNIPQPQPPTESALLMPLQAELQTLLQQRATLVQEIRQLEQKRLHNYSLTQQMANQEKIISEFLQVLMTRLSPNLAPQPGGAIASTLTIDAPNSSTITKNATEPDQVERFTRLTTELDQRLIALDGTVNVVFDALQRNINTYHESLSQSLARMHNQGIQGEQLLISIINDLTEHLQHQTALLNQSDDKNKTLLTLENTLVTNNYQETDNKTEDTAIAPEIEAMLQQLERETQAPSIKEASVELQNHNSELRDEVDQLYASLFGNENLTQLNQEIPAKATTEVTPVEEISSVPAELSPELIDAINAETFEITFEVTSELPTSTSQQPDSAIVMSDPWFDEPDAGLLNLSNTQAQENFTLTPTAQSLDLFNTLEHSETEGASIEKPTSTDTITVLTDLLTNASNNPESQALVNQDPQYPQEIVPSLEESGNLVAIAPTPEIIDDYDDLERSLNNYVPASATENLLDYQENPEEAVSAISLEQEQLQQLEQDLADFDRQLNSLLQPVSNTQPQENTATATNEVILEGIDSAVQNETNHTEPENTVDSVWYLGLDLGTTGISAALLNRSTIELYPVYWSAENLSVTSSSTQSQRLPAEVYLPAEAITETEQIPVIAPVAVQPHHLFSAQLKPYLQICLPYKEQGQWTPVLQLNELSTVPLVWVVRSLAKLLLTLKSDRSSTTLGLTAAAIGLDQKTFHTIINNIAGVICTCPSNWSEQYRFNVREAILTSMLVQHPQQVFFVEEAIASLLPELDGANGEQVKLSAHQGNYSVKTSDHSLLGNTLIVSIGANTTEMALVDVPEILEDLTHSDFMLHGFAYAGAGIEQDIICQLLLPPKWRQPRTFVEDENKNEQSLRHWSPAIAGLDQMLLSSLKWEELNLPRPGEPDIIDRIRLQQRLESSLLGKGVQEAAIALKLILQHQDSFTLELADQQWILQRRDLESQVFVPFVRRLNRELNRLLIAKGIPTEAINQAILTGGVGSVGAVSRWLRQKLPNAKMIQNPNKSDSAPTCSRVAYGLALLPLHPQVLEVPRQQYTDYFLFTELLQLLPERTISFSEIVQLFENRGINTRSCQQRLLAFLEGELPPGLIPSATDFTWLTQSSKENSDYQAISAAPLFEKQGSLNYRPNSHQRQHVLRYLDAIKASTGQSLSEPYTVNFAVGVVQ